VNAPGNVGKRDPGNFVAADIHYALRDRAAPALNRDLQWPADGGPPRANISLGEYGLSLLAEGSVVLTLGVGTADAMYDPSLSLTERVLAAAGDVAKGAAIAIPMVGVGRAAEGAIAGAAKGAASATPASSAAQGALLRARLAAEEVAGARLPQAITGYTRHGLNQAISRDGVGVSTRAIADAFKNPTSIAGQSGGRFVLTGRDAVVVVNADGKVVTTWATTSAGFRVVP
jgi:hypothetical protein